MQRVLANAVLLAGLLIPACLFAQSRGGPRFSFSHFSGSFRSYRLGPPMRPMPRQSSSVRSGRIRPGITFPPVTGTSLINPGEASCILNPSFAGSYYCRQYFPYGAAWGFEPVYPYWLPTTGYETDQTAAPAPEVEQDSQLADQVSNLTAAVEMMREDQAMRNSRSAPAAELPVAPLEKPPTTVIVYRDGHQMEVQNYAILGHTLWVFSGETTRRVPLADLNLAATTRVNEQRGVDFVAPATQ